ncbi:hypothetical protein BCR33DRAFT_842435 [Rhizoclosmatium globosum]|uniref:ALOG domain-containing protein n=1 Tax=Rhizoclosmatium globosum TaxID=329046 RepID=A0A1Y2B3N2_9FUNG|nr:hypothetical protein BCR33DRAFT_842435 [Rhizoclosmatium globosum]|eukprot:ORY29431.1 hypothetical protein BCR33DRAFT_842435 [Rhizoclosmatium globosum]
MALFASFLQARTARPPIKPPAATPVDVVEYLAHKDRSGRTQFHSSSCTNVQANGPRKRVNTACNPTICIVRAAPNSIVAATSKLRTGMEELGCRGPWDPRRGTGNPTNSSLVEHHLKRLGAEANEAGVLPQQALPLSGSISKKLWQPVLSRIADQAAAPLTRLFWRQFWIFFNLCLSSGRRPGDLVRLRTPTVVWLPDKSGVLVTMVFGKTATINKPDRFVIKDANVLNALRLYVNDCLKSGFDLHKGRPFIFFDIASNSTPESAMHTEVDKFVSTFQNILKELGEFNGETLYGFRVGNSIAVKLDSTSVEQAIMQAGGWRTADSARHYSQFAIAAAHVGENADPIAATSEWLRNLAQYSYF